MKKSRKTGEGIEIVWSEFASEMLMKTYDYYAEVAGVAVAKSFISKIFKSTEQLKNYPQSGQIETTLKLLNEGHRYLVTGNHKIIYKLIDSHRILITDVFDTRQDPRAMQG